MSTMSAGAFPLSPQQARLWSELGPDARARVVVHLEGALDTARLQAAMAALTDGDEILRAEYVPLEGAGTGVLLVAPNRPSLHYARTELEPGRHELVLELPALSCDRHGLVQLVRAVVARYRAETAPGSGRGMHPTAAPRYTEVAGTYNEFLDAPEARGGRQYFSRGGFAGGVRSVNSGAPFAPREVRVALPAAASIHKAGPPSAVLLAAWHTLVRGASDGGATCMGIAYDGRTYAGLDAAVGLYERFLPFRAKVEDSSSLERAARDVQARIEADSEWQDFFDLQRSLTAKGECVPEVPYFPVSFAAFAWPEPMEASGVRFEITALESTTSRFDLQLLCLERGGGVEAVLKYDSSRCAPQKAEFVAEKLATWLAGAIAHPARPMVEISLTGLREIAWLDSDSGSPSGSAVEPIEPASDAERMVAAIWSDVLRLPSVGVHQNFFDLGGHSLSMAAVYEKLAASLGRPIPMVELFRHPTVSSLANHIAGIVSQGPAPGETNTAAARQRSAREAQALRHLAARRRAR